MKQPQPYQKKYIVLPVILIAGIVITSVFTTATSAVSQSVKGNIANLATDSEQVEEALHAKTSLTFLSDKINALGFSKGNSEYIRGVNAPLALR